MGILKTFTRPTTGKLATPSNIRRLARRSEAQGRFAFSLSAYSNTPSSSRPILLNLPADRHLEPPTNRNVRGRQQAHVLACGLTFLAFLSSWIPRNNGD